MIIKSENRRKVISNPLKRTDLFRCAHMAHKDFDFVVSAYHVLHEKECYPDGCIDFRWNCTALNRGDRCHRGFSFVGKDCHDCRHFDEEKIQRIPRLLISREQYCVFCEELEDFEWYFQNILRKSIDFSGIVASVKPLVAEGSNPENWRYSGFLLHFKSGYLDIDSIKDDIFAQIDRRCQQRNQFRAGDRVEFRCCAVLNRGRIVLKKIREINFIERGQGHIWDLGTARVALASGMFLKSRPGKCRRCQMGLLVDNSRDSCDISSRRIFCLQGIENPEECVYKIYSKYIENN